MRYFLDTEFMESRNELDLLSIGLVDENGRSFYAEVSDADFDKANKWVVDNVFPKLKFKDCNEGNYFTLSDKEGNIEVWGDTYFIKLELFRFIGSDKPEFWGDYAAYDWVAFCWIFGSMDDLPEGWPMYCNDLMQLKGDRDVVVMEPVDAHNALVDAQQNKLLYEKLTK